MNFAEQIENLIKEIETDPNAIKKLTPEQIENMNEEQVTKVRKLGNPYGRTIQGSEKVHAISVLNMKEDYIRKFQTTALVAFLYRMQNEYNTDPYVSEAFVRRIRFGANKIDFKSDDIDFINLSVIDKIELVRYENGVPLPDKVFVNKFDDMFNDEGMCMVEESDAQYFERKSTLQAFMDHENSTKRRHIKEFLDSLFMFNPDMHVRRAREKLTGNYKANLDSMRTSSGVASSGVASSGVASSGVASSGVVSSDANVISGVAPSSVVSSDANVISGVVTSSGVSSIFETTKHIPLDTFARFKYYCDSNFTEIREAVSMLYSIQPDIDYAINIYDSFTPNSEMSAEQQADAFISKHQNEVIADIVSIKGGKWALMGAFKENRTRVNFLNDNTNVLADMFKQIETDAKLGADLMKKRVLIKKNQNEKREGPIHPNFLRYTKENIPSVHSMGAQPVTEDSVVLAEKDNQYPDEIVDNTPVAFNNLPEVDEQDSIEVPVFSVNLKDNTVKTSVFHTKAEAINK